MLYYKDNNQEGYVACTSPMGEGFERITKEEYEEATKAMEPTKEEIIANKQAQLRALMLELAELEGEE